MDEPASPDVRPPPTSAATWIVVGIPVVNAVPGRQGLPIALLLVAFLGAARFTRHGPPAREPALRIV